MLHDEIWLIAGTLAIFLISAAVTALSSLRNFHWRWLLLAALLFIINDAMLTNGLYQLPYILPKGEMNWQGKILALVVSLAIAAHPAIGWRNIGLRLKQADGSMKALVIPMLLYVAYVCTLAYIFPNSPPSGEDIAFQATLPGIEESVFFLGLLLFVLDRAFTGRWRFLGVDWGWSILLGSILFGLVHALSFSDGGFHFDPLNFALTSLPSVLVYGIYKRTGSLLIPIALHNAGNLINLFF